MFEPPDYKSQEPYGTCGLAVIAVLEGKSVEEIKTEWEKVNGKYPNSANLKGMIKLLKALGYSVERHNGGKIKTFPSRANQIIARIQWLKEDGTEYYWAEAPIHTHYVLIRDKTDIFCNGYGWFKSFSLHGRNYLNKGYISSYLVVE